MNGYGTGAALGPGQFGRVNSSQVTKQAGSQEMRTVLRVEKQAIALICKNNSYSS